MIKNNSSLFFLEKALSKKARIAIPEQDDPRIKLAIKVLKDFGFDIVSIDLLKDKYDIYRDLISKKKFTKNWSEETYNSFLKNPINLSFVSLLNNDIDCGVAGATVSSSEIIRSAIRVLGLKSKVEVLSSSFFMLSPNMKKKFTYSDCAVIPEPNIKQFCSIAYEAACSHELLSGEKPKVAFLSFSTKGSAEHYKVNRIQEAYKLFTKKYPDILCDGELQFDSAINSDIAKKKNANSMLDGDANVFVFPDLDSGNIAYKITQHIGGYCALGPLLQGLNKPFHDLSRGCSVDDIVSVSMIAALQSI
tara:strand:+ start:467 stop:1381 length:915 start_codon:yes stop_codon:yes gene_type:complete